MFTTKDYLPALFFCHLLLEKLCKAHWVKDNTDNIPPKLHDLPTLVLKTKLKLKEEEIDFLREMNQFQIEGRYPDYKNLLYNTYREEKTKLIIDKVNTMKICLLNKL
jgi:HEPN domain-containing protein